MTPEVLVFDILAVIAIIAGIGVVVSRNPVHSVLWLIVAFFNAAGLMVLIGAEFIAMLLVIVYVGAVAINSAPTRIIRPAALKKARISHITEWTGLRDAIVMAPDRTTTRAKR